MGCQSPCRPLEMMVGSLSQEAIKGSPGGEKARMGRIGSHGKEARGKGSRDDVC